MGNSNANARVLIAALVFALSAGIAVVLIDKDYRPKKIAESNSGVFTQIPFDPPADLAEETDHR